MGLASAMMIAAWLWVSWQQAREAQIARMTTTVKLLAAHADHYFAAFGNRIELLAKDLSDGDPAELSRAAVQPLLQAFQVANPDLVSVSLIRPDGQMFAAGLAHGAAPLPSMLRDPAWREDFARDLRAPGLSIDRPQPGMLINKLVIHLRYPVRDARGRVRYLIQAGLPLEKQQVLWRDLGLKQDAALGLFRDDGYLVSRLPGGQDVSAYYKQYRGGALYEAVRKSPEGGEYEGRVLADGTYRIGVYQRLSEQPMYAFLSHLRSTFVAVWWEQVRWPLSMAAGFLLASLLAYAWLAARYARRMRLIEKETADAESGALAELPSSGVSEIDALVAALAQSREKLREAARNREKLLLAAAEGGTYAVRESDGVVLAADEAFLRMLGRSEAEVVGRPWNHHVRVEEGAAADGNSLARRVAHTLPPGSARRRWISLAEYRESTAHGGAVRHGLAIDVTEREHLLSHVHAQSLRMQALWRLATTRGKSEDEKMRLMLRLTLDTLRMDTVMVNELQGETLTVRQVADDLQRFHVGQEFSLNDALCRLAIEHRQALIVNDLASDPVLAGHPVSCNLGVRGFTSVPIWEGGRLYGTMVFMRRVPLDESFSVDDRAFVELLASWFGQMLLEQQQRRDLERLAMTDALTGLINRRAAEARFGEELARAKRARETFSIAVCDLDRFKLVNDHYGHDVGDQVLLHVAGLMKGGLREGDWVARWGGEEFIIFLHHSDAASAYAAMERLRLAVKEQPVRTAHGPLEITASIGIGSYSGEGGLAEVLSEADGCLFEAKRAGRDHVVVSESSRRGTLWKAGMLQHALLENRVVPAYQAIVDLRTNRVVADEALARLIEPDGRVVAAGEFIEAAEGINLIHVVDEIISRQAMQRCALDICTGKASPTFAHFVNLSPQFLARGELVQAMLATASAHCVGIDMVETKVKPLVLEITERQLLTNFDDLQRELRPLLDFGFRLALDDFGSGYSSFLYLATLPISFLKIEGWMVRNLRTNLKVLAMVRNIIALAREQGITTIAECVEDAETAALLRELGADWAQGYYFGYPRCDFEAAGAPASAEASAAR